MSRKLHASQTYCTFTHRTHSCDTQVGGGGAGGQSPEQPLRLPSDRNHSKGTKGKALQTPDRSWCWHRWAGITHSLSLSLSLSLTHTHTHTHTHTEYYSATKKNEMPFTATWMDLEIIILSKSDRERQISYDITYR